MREKIDFGSKRIVFQLIYAERKSLGITVTPDCDVIITAPHGASLDRIKEKVEKKAPWIIRQQDFFLPFHPKSLEPQYRNGESLLYLGREYRLSVISGKKKSVHYKGRFIEVQTTNKSQVKQQVRQWYKLRAREKFAEIAEPLILRFKRYGVEPSGIYVQEMRLRWGSCTPTGKIILNTDLIRAPKGCIEYVIIHELCHLIHHNHTRKFIELQNREMPDWEKWKNKLEQLLA